MFGTAVNEIAFCLSERLNYLNYVTLFHYWDSGLIFIEGIIPWQSTLALTLLAILFFLIGLIFFERKDLAA